jgi:hypothetical protein
MKKKQIKSFGMILVFAVLAIMLAPSLLSEDSTPSAEVATTTIEATSEPSEVPDATTTEAPSTADVTPKQLETNLSIGDYNEDGTYNRDLFGSAWADVDNNGCDTRNDVLTRDIVNAVIAPDCKVQSGNVTDPYSGVALEFVRGQGTSNLVPVDHIIALGDAYYAAGYAWSPDERAAFANDPINLISTTQIFNSWKSDKTPSEMLDTEYQLEKHDVVFVGKCFYAEQYVDIAIKYELPVRQVDSDALDQMLSSCSSS